MVHVDESGNHVVEQAQMLIVGQPGGIEPG